MIHDRFHARWEQPTSIVREGANFVTTLKLRIGKDGQILQREIVNSSGSPMMDDSVLTAANNVRQIDPLPRGLGNGEYFDIKVNFKLDQDP
jgi:TonB family protein